MDVRSVALRVYAVNPSPLQHTARSEGGGNQACLAWLGNGPTLSMRILIDSAVAKQTRRLSFAHRQHRQRGRLCDGHRLVWMTERCASPAQPPDAHTRTPSVSFPLATIPQVGTTRVKCNGQQSVSPHIKIIVSSPCAGRTCHGRCASFERDFCRSEKQSCFVHSNESTFVHGNGTSTGARHVRTALGAQTTQAVCVRAALSIVRLHRVGRGAGPGEILIVGPPAAVADGGWPGRPRPLILRRRCVAGGPSLLVGPLSSCQ